MKCLRVSTVTIEDDYGLLIEIVPLDIDKDMKKIKDEVTSFFTGYRICKAYAKPHPIEQRKEELAKKHIGRAISNEKELCEGHPTLAKMLSTNQRIYIIKEHLPKEFGMDDFIDYVVANHNYSNEDAKNMWKLTQTFLQKTRAIQLVDANAPKNKYKYRYIGTVPEEISDKIKILENGGKVELSN